MIGEVLSHYRIVDKLGEGGMGEVYLAEDTRLKRRVALKLLPAEMASDPERLSRFQREAETVAALNHLNIVTIYSTEQADGRSFLTMELVEGQTLDRQITAGGLGLERLFELAIPMADAISEAHAKGITHRDLKPANVMVTAKGQVKILDFGLAKLSESPLEDDGEATAALTRDGLVVGTVRYMSPEQARSEPADHRSDVFSFGVLLYEMATGERPFQGSSSVELLSSILKDEPPSITERKAGLPNHLGRIVRRCLEKDPEKRYQSALDIRNELQDLKRELDALASRAAAEEPTQPVPRARSLPWPRVVVALLAVAAAAWWWTTRDRDAGEPTAPAATLAELELLVEDERYPEAFMLHRELPARLAAGPDAVEALERSSRTVTIRTLPDEATVSIRPYGGEGPWLELGSTPLDGVRVPRGFVAVKIEREGHEPYRLAMELDETSEWRLPPATVPEGMTWVPPGPTTSSPAGSALLGDALELPAFYIDRYEVTNRDFQEFVDSDGYESPELWPPFVREGSPVAWEVGIGELVDRTGVPGPTGWELGSFAEGEATLPVTGVSWYEAMAYAAWREKELPTVFHWSRAAQTGASPYIVPASNFGESLLPAEGERGLGVWGTRDLAGNAKEWSRSAAAGGRPLLMGGSWSEPSYTYFVSYDERSPWDRELDFGFRCMREQDSEAAVPAAAAPIEVQRGRDVLAAEPADDATFEIYRSLHEYDRGPLEPEETTSDETSAHWTRTNVTVDAGHGGQRLPILLYLPKTGAPPYQVAVLFAGANALRQSSSAASEALVSFDAVDFLIRSGRAVAIPVLLGMYERQDGYNAVTASPIEDRDHFMVWTKEVRRTVDYLAGRGDLQTDKLLYVGSSLGALVGPVILALEPRFTAAYLRMAGVISSEVMGEVDPINFAPRVKVPTLMLNGRYDRLIPLETGQRALYNLLGTAEEDKRMILFEVGHAAPRPRNRAIREVLAWADRVLGPVE